MSSEIGLRLQCMKGAETEANGYGYGRVAAGEYTTFNMKGVRLYSSFDYGESLNYTVQSLWRQFTCWCWCKKLTRKNPIVCFIVYLWSSLTRNWIIISWPCGNKRIVSLFSFLVYFFSRAVNFMFHSRAALSSVFFVPFERFSPKMTRLNWLLSKLIRMMKNVGIRLADRSTNNYH